MQGVRPWAKQVDMPSCSLALDPRVRRGRGAHFLVESMTAKEVEVAADRDAAEEDFVHREHKFALPCA